MFDLETSIAAWRRSLEHDAAFLADDLDELEQHVRDQVAGLAASGLSLEAAFRRTMDEMGDYATAEKEYQKVYWGKLKQRKLLVNELETRLAMLKNHLKIALRNAWRHRGFTAINVGGLAVGLAACLLIGLYVQDELRFDDFHTRGDRIYRLGGATVGWPYGHLIEDQYPEVEDVVYMRPYPALTITRDGKHFFDKVEYADAGFFKMFDFPLLEGNPETALALPMTLVLSEATAQKLFGETDVVGRSLTLGDSLDFTITGVARVPRRSHIQFGALLSFETLRTLFGAEGFEQEMNNGWLDLNVVNYVLLRQGVDADAFAEKIAGMPQRLAGDILSRWGASDYQLGLTPMRDIYLDPDAGNALGPSSDVRYVYLLGVVGLLLLIIACINFINLSTARSMQRAREVGVRKVVGSNRAGIVRQFMTEVFVMCMLALVLAMGIAVLALPYFNALAARAYAVADLLSPGALLAIVLLGVVVALLAGFYPSVSLSSFRPVEVLKGRFATGRHGERLRQGLVIFQFAASGVLILGTLAVFSQLRFMQRQQLGFDGDQVVVLDARQAPSRELARRADALKQALEASPSVQRVSNTWTVPGRSGWRGQLSFPEGMPDGQSVSLEYVPVDFDFVKTLGLKLIAGRDFDENLSTDATDAVIINRAAVEAAGWTSPQEAVGKLFTSPGSGKPNSRVVGVVEDYHQRGLQEQIAPIMFGIRPGNGLLAIRFDGKHAADVVDHIEATWGQFFGEYPYDYFFLDQAFARQYDQERRLMRIFGTFALLTIVIACLGLFGLAAFTTALRTKEIGVRKVMGASVTQVAALLSRDFLMLVLIAFVVAAPVAYYAASRWLDGFAYRTTLGAGLFALGGAALLLIGLLTVSYQAVRAATADPVRSLRYE